MRPVHPSPRRPALGCRRMRCASSARLDGVAVVPHRARRDPRCMRSQSSRIRASGDALCGAWGDNGQRGGGEGGTAWVGSSGRGGENRRCVGGDSGRAQRVHALAGRAREGRGWWGTATGTQALEGCRREFEVVWYRGEGEARGLQTPRALVLMGLAEAVKAGAKQPAEHRLEGTTPEIREERSRRLGGSL
ncbi:hypothetical protein B0H11DRAFT_2210587 [Mycena galericulata]|nr:hypothetical protein B0H11DRAFT_2210587 [Mycena galericulata]